MKTDYAGIDYSGPGATCNRDRETGIRYGIIGQGAVMPEAIDDFEPEYGDPHCPKCGNEAVAYNDDKHGEYDCAKHECADHACEECEYVFGNESAFGDEPIGHSYDTADGYSLSLDSSGDVWVFKSPYFTYAQFCSPCAPGACYLGNPLAEPVESNRCYCLGHDWFDGGKAPYDVWSVETGKLVQPAS